eukprot:scaffold930_cov408-Prasinococcus_capsulatus_cf.AAC.2
MGTNAGLALRVLSFQASVCLKLADKSFGLVYHILAVRNVSVSAAAPHEHGCQQLGSLRLLPSCRCFREVSLAVRALHVRRVDWCRPRISGSRVVVVPVSGQPYLRTAGQP